LDTLSDALHDLDSHLSPEEAVFVERISYHGWVDSIHISNGAVEAVVVPSIGRVMQFCWAGCQEGVFWENPALLGQLHDSASEEWINFGGDKSWPAPQSGWAAYQGRDWPPPVAFDSCEVQAEMVDFGVVLTSPVDPGFGIQVVRCVELNAHQPVMKIRTEYHKLAGAPVRVAIWTITQMKEPDCVAVLLPLDSKLPNGYLRLIDAEPQSLSIKDGLLSLKRHQSEYVKIGTDSLSMAWIGEKTAMRIDAERLDGEYPDGGCVTEIYTNPDPLRYVELETLGPLSQMSVGDVIAQTTTYTLMARPFPDAEIAAIQTLGL
jgi:hypothetical protein